MGSGRICRQAGALLDIIFAVIVDFCYKRLHVLCGTVRHVFSSMLHDYNVVRLLRHNTHRTETARF